MKMKIKQLLIPLLVMGLYSCDKYEKLNNVESHSEISTTEGSTECSYNGVIAGAHVKASYINGNTNMELLIYANSDEVDSVVVSSEKPHIFKTVAIPYKETISNSCINLNTEYDYSITWDNGSISIYYIAKLKDGTITVQCNSHVN